MLLFLLLVTSVTSSQIDCFLDNQECEATADNLIGFFMDIETAEECLTLCSDDHQCSAFTFFGATSEPFALACFLYTSCRTRVSCLDCTTGSNQADCTCSINYSGHVGGNNVVDIVASVNDEFVCKKICLLNEDCSIYTFYNSGDPTNHNVCILLSATGLQNPVSSCAHCTTGPASCKTDQQCQVAVFFNNDVALQSLATSYFAEQSMSLTFLAREKDCFANMSILTVGGGGEDHRYGTGGGSGFVETGAAVLKPKSQVVLNVRGAHRSSSVVVDGQVVVEAKQGGDGGDSGGGNGYSGGGGYRTSGGASDPRGGEDGGDGWDGDYKPGGHGNRLDIRQITLRDFELTPGAGGEHVVYSDTNWRGGGGGGVLVNGLAPEAGEYNGQGYGGGGGYQMNGNPGCVIIEL